MDSSLREKKGGFGYKAKVKKMTAKKKKDETVENLQNQVRAERGVMRVAKVHCSKPGKVGARGAKGNNLPYQLVTAYAFPLSFSNSREFSFPPVQRVRRQFLAF